MSNDTERLAEISESVRELNATVDQRVRRLEAQVARQSGSHPSGYTPQDQNSGDSDYPLARRQQRAWSGIELGKHDSYAAWSAARGTGRVLEPGEFSLGRLVRAMVVGDRNRLSELERQAVVEGTDAGGGILIGEQIVGGIIDLVRARTAVVEAGATVIPMDTDSAVWARVATGATPLWKAEMAPMGESALTFSAMHLRAHTLRTKVVLSAEFQEDAPPEAELAIEREIIAAFANEVDRVALFGSGVGAEPLGLTLTPGVNVTAAVTFESYAPLSKAITLVRAANHEPDAILESATAAGILDALVAEGGQPLQPPPSVATMPVFVTNLVGGPAGAAGTVIVGQWDQLVIGARPNLQVRIRPVEGRLAVDFATEIVCSLRMDVGVVDPAAFQVLQSAALMAAERPMAAAKK